METIISVVIYRVFNVKVAFKGNVKHDIEMDQEIQIRIKDFHFDNVIPFIEGEWIAALPRKITFDDVADSGISESSVTSPSTLVIKQEPLDIEYDEPINDFESSTRKRKRNNEIDLDATTSQPAKKIKQEIIEEEVPPVSIKQERISDDELLNDSLVSKEIEKVKNSEPAGSSEESSQKKKKKKKDKKHKKDKSNADDFESSLMMLFGTPKVKQEN
jgi:hypothetical protein